MGWWRLGFPGQANLLECLSPSNAPKQSSSTSYTRHPDELNTPSEGPMPFPGFENEESLNGLCKQSGKSAIWIHADLATFPHAGFVQNDLYAGGPLGETNKAIFSTWGGHMGVRNIHQQHGDSEAPMPLAVSKFALSLELSGHDWTAAGTSLAVLLRGISKPHLGQEDSRCAPAVGALFVPVANLQTSPPQTSFYVSMPRFCVERDLRGAPKRGFSVLLRSVSTNLAPTRPHGEGRICATWAPAQPHPSPHLSRA